MAGLQKCIILSVSNSEVAVYSSSLAVNTVLHKSYQVVVGKVPRTLCCVFVSCVVVPINLLRIEEYICSTDWLRYPPYCIPLEWA